MNVTKNDFTTNWKKEIIRVSCTDVNYCTNFLLHFNLINLPTKLNVHCQLCFLGFANTWILPNCFKYFSCGCMGLKNNSMFIFHTIPYNYPFNCCRFNYVKYMYKIVVSPVFYFHTNVKIMNSRTCFTYPPTVTMAEYDKWHKQRGWKCRS